MSCLNPYWISAHWKNLRAKVGKRVLSDTYLVVVELPENPIELGFLPCFYLPFRHISPLASTGFHSCWRRQFCDRLSCHIQTLVVFWLIEETSESNLARRFNPKPSLPVTELTLHPIDFRAFSMSSLPLSKKRHISLAASTSSHFFFLFFPRLCSVQQSNYLFFAA